MRCWSTGFVLDYSREALERGADCVCGRGIVLEEGGFLVGCLCEVLERVYSEIQGILLL